MYMFISPGLSSATLFKKVNKVIILHVYLLCSFLISRCVK